VIHTQDSWKRSTGSFTQEQDSLPGWTHFTIRLDGDPQKQFLIVSKFLPEVGDIYGQTLDDVVIKFEWIVDDIVGPEKLQHIVASTPRTCPECKRVFGRVHPADVCGYGATLFVMET